MIRLDAWWAQGQHITVDGHRIFTQVQGAGPTLVFLHGFPTSSHDWAPVIEDLVRDYRCVTFDYLGYGASDKPPAADYSSYRQTDRALRVLQALGVTRAAVVGHDLGGILLQQILHRDAEGRLDLVLDRAVFSNSSVFAELYRPTPAQVVLVDPAQGKALARQVSQASLGVSLAALFPSDPPGLDLADDLWAAIAREDGHHLWPEQLVYMAERATQGSAWVDAMRRSQVPMGFLYGLADPVSGAQILERAAADLPGAQCIGLPGLGHYPQLESPPAYAAALRRLLAT